MANINKNLKKRKSLPEKNLAEETKRRRSITAFKNCRWKCTNCRGNKSRERNKERERENKLLKVLPLSRKQQKPFTEKLEVKKKGKERNQKKGKSENKRKKLCKFFNLLEKNGTRSFLYCADLGVGAESNRTVEIGIALGDLDRQIVEKNHEMSICRYYRWYIWRKDGFDWLLVPACCFLSGSVTGFFIIE